MEIEVIYKMLINDIELTDKTLESYGITKKNINKLINDNKIRISNGKYELVHVKEFFKYGLKLFKQGNISSANACFYKCYELCPKNSKICHQALTVELKRQKKRGYKDYKSAFDIFLSLEKIPERKTQNNNKLYLYLLSYIYNDMPEEYKEKVANFKEFDLMLEDKISNRDENKIREAIIKKRFKYAFSLIDKLINKQNDYCVKFETLRALLDEVVESKKKYNNKLLTLIKEEKYGEIVNILESSSKLMGLTKTEENTLKVVKSIIKIKSTNIIPLISNEDFDTLQDIISNNNFELAYSLVTVYLEEHQINKDNNTLYLVLVNINSLIYNLKNKKINDIEELAYYIKEKNISLEEAFKKYGLTIKSLLLIKLIYVRDYYIEGMYFEGDTLLKEVEVYKEKFLDVDKYIEELKINRDKYKEKLDIYTKSRNKHE